MMRLKIHRVEKSEGAKFLNNPGIMSQVMKFDRHFQRGQGRVTCEKKSEMRVDK